VSISNVSGGSSSSPFSLGQSYKLVNSRWIIVGVVCAALFGCVSKKTSSASSRTRPIVVHADEVEREDRQFNPISRPDGTALLFFLFKSRTREEVAQLVESGVRDGRPLHLIDGQGVVSRGWVAGLAGPARGHAIHGEERYGLVVGFTTPTEALQAATCLREDPWEALDRHLSDRRTWILPPSSGGQSVGPRLPSTGLPAPLTRSYGR
jgi:hypothetical protein